MKYELRFTIPRWGLGSARVLPNSFRLHYYYIGKSHIVPMKWEQVEKLKARIREEIATPPKKHVGPGTSSAPSDFPIFSDVGSNSLTFEADDRA